uniref:Uncharacterized protein n=1 Tax=Coptotermes formosanus TaxID=36987 RepID=R4V0P2_COPFO|nr:hypothetical protein [Coptotermes formosanus]
MCHFHASILYFFYSQKTARVKNVHLYQVYCSLKHCFHAPIIRILGPDPQYF